MTSGAGQLGGRSGSESGRYTARRLRSALSLWRSSIRGTDILAAGVLVALSLGLGAYLLARAQAAAHLAFAERTRHLLAAVTERLLQPSEDLAALQSLLEASGPVNRRQFRNLTKPTLRRNRLVYALEWLPLVRESERSVYEAEAQASGLTDYRFWETGPDGRPREAGRRPYYVPIHYMEPPSALALGFDVAADPGRWRIAQTARDSGRIAASSPFRLIQDTGNQDASPAVVMYAPVYREGDPGSEEGRRASLTGFAMAIFRVAPLVDAAAAAGDASGLAFVMRDLDAEGVPALAQRPPGAAALPRRAGFELEFPVEFADRRWALNIFAPPGAFLPATRGAIGWASAGVLAALFGLVTVTSLRTISRLRRQAEKVGPYRLVARLGGGAMGVVWEARHALLRRPTAVKLLAPGTEGERSLARFEREVQLTAGLTHPSTIAIYDYGRTAEGTFYYAMELLRGINLLQLVAFEGPLPSARAVHFLKQACGALAEAHAAGLIHRDIKPANLMICVQGGIPDFLKVLDFGLVKDIGAVDRLPEGKGQAGVDAALSQNGSLLGTPLYLAPEGMSDPAAVDARADIFALGGVGYFLLTGHSPFPGRTAIEVFAMERRGPPAARELAAHPVPAALEETISRCLAFRRESRPGSAETLAAMLDECAVTPPWSLENAKTWWRDRGPAALEAARAQREERGQILVLSSRSGDRRPQ
ncbi:MAG: CHASE domain-containing protein [Thermoanaerobaculia bacterium]